MSGQLVEYQDGIQFKYGVAPSLGKHQMETYEYAVGKETQLFGIPSTFQIGYLNSRLAYFEVSEISRTEPYERLHLLDLNIGATKHFAKQWDFSFHFNPQFSSSFSSGVSSEDVILGYGLGISKKWNTSILEIGVERSTVLGEPRLLPYIGYHQKVSTSLDLLIGFPNSFLGYTINERHKLSTNVHYEGNYYNISGDTVFIVSEEIANSKLNFSSINFSLNYYYRIQPNICAITQLGMLTNNDFKVDDLSGDSLYEFNTNESVYFSMGLQFNINK